MGLTVHQAKSHQCTGTCAAYVSLAHAAAETGTQPETLTLPEYVYATYNELMKNGWRMKEIDEMDMLGFLRLRAWDAQREHEKKKPRQRFIDEVRPGLKP
jgi:hypothetical protein